MTTNEDTGFGPHESVGNSNRVTAAVRRSERGDLTTVYRIGQRVYQDVDDVEAVLRGDSRWD